jgi:hypothetical protein
MDFAILPPEVNSGRKLNGWKLAPTAAEPAMALGPGGGPFDVGGSGSGFDGWKAVSASGLDHGRPGHETGRGGVANHQPLCRPRGLPWQLGKPAQPAGAGEYGRPGDLGPRRHPPSGTRRAVRPRLRGSADTRLAGRFFGGNRPRDPRIHRTTRQTRRASRLGVPDRGGIRPAKATPAQSLTRLTLYHPVRQHF